MTSPRNKELGLLLFGDITLFFVALWLSLLLRYFQLPSVDRFMLHVLPFAVLFFVWVVVFFVAGLYDKHTVILKDNLSMLIINTQIVNLIIAAVFFFSIPFFGITPKTILLIYLIISSLLIIAWRLYVFPLFWSQEGRHALLIGEGPEIEELVKEVNNNTRYGFVFSRIVDLEMVRNTKDIEAKLLDIIKGEQIAIVVTDSRNVYLEPFFPSLFDLTFLHSRATFIDLYKVYETIFDRVPLSALRYNWFLEHIPQSSHIVYDFLKRLIDLIGAFVLCVPLAITVPFVWLVTRLQGGGPIFITQERIGQHGSLVRVTKFRTMRTSENGVWIGESTNTVTPLGAFLRKTSLDELPQVLNVLKGDMSLIGPRNDLSKLGERLAEAIPYYNIRYMIKPGITGWAQTHQRYSPGNISPQSIEETKVRLAYDLYYVKNRSLWLDLGIALRTLGTLLGRFGSSFQVRYSSLYGKR